MNFAASVIGCQNQPAKAGKRTELHFRPPTTPSREQRKGGAAEKMLTIHAVV
jgi:hypothetical protein